MTLARPEAPRKAPRAEAQDAVAAPVLAIEDLRTAFRVDGAWVEVVRGVSFRIDAGETVAVVGESGSGKSVTALSVMRLLPPGQSRITGSVRLAGRSLLDLDETAMQDVRGAAVSMIFQEPMTSLNPVLTVGFQVGEALMRHRGLDAAAARAEAIRLFDLVRIPDGARRLTEFPHTFSGGMRQRVMIAMALAGRPKLLIADEPTTALDVTIQAQTLALMREIQAEIGMAVLFITHDMGVVAEIADRTVVMLRGEAVEEGPTATVLKRPVHAYSRRLIGSVPVLGALKGVATPRRFPSFAADGQAVAPPPEADARGKPILEVEGLTTRFAVRGGPLGRRTGAVHAVENVSFSLREGETLALVGESGCGKSTTGRSILRLVEPQAGAIRFEGRDLMRASRAELRASRRRLQMIFQDPYGSLNPRKTVGAALTEPMAVHGLRTGPEADAEVARLLDVVGLEPAHALRFPHEFSGGQRQRLCIARCLAVEPRLIVADEAVSALDVSIKAQVVNLMLDLQARFGLAFLFISHDIAVVERVSHRIAVMYLGEIVEIGPRDAVLNAPQHPYTRKLMAAVPSPDPDAPRTRPDLMTDDLKSPVRPLGWEPERRAMIEAGPEHFFRDH